MRFLWLAMGLAVAPVVAAPEAVVLVHGFMRSEKCMRPLKRRCERAGFEVVNWDYPSRNGTIEEHAAELCAELQLMVARDPEVRIHFVTHSMGGLVIRRALSDPRCPPQARHGAAVLLAPPNGGSAFARTLRRFAPTRKLLGHLAGEELMTRSFADLAPFPDEMEVLVVAGTLGFNPLIHERNDGKVGVGETELDGAALELVRAGHSWIMWSPKVMGRAIGFIQEVVESPAT